MQFNGCRDTQLGNLRHVLERLAARRSVAVQCGVQRAF